MTRIRTERSQPGWCSRALSAMALTLLGLLVQMWVMSQPSAAQLENASANAAKSAPLPSEVSLKNIKDVVHRLRVAALDVINDVEQRDMVVTGEPELIQPIAYKDKNSISWAREMLELGPAQPPRKRWLDADMAHLGNCVELLQSDFDGTAFSADAKNAVNASWAEMGSVVKDVQQHYKTLQELTKGPRYDNIAIGKEALGIYDDMAKLSKPWKEVLSTIRARG